MSPRMVVEVPFSPAYCSQNLDHLTGLFLISLAAGLLMGRSLHGSLGCKQTKLELLWVEKGGGSAQIPKRGSRESPPLAARCRVLPQHVAPEAWAAGCSSLLSCDFYPLINESRAVRRNGTLFHDDPERSPLEQGFHLGPSRKEHPLMGSLPSI